jgi:membrane protein implicated in regulation of membrane protease activity
MKKGLYIAAGIILIIIGFWLFITGKTSQTVVNGFALSSIGAVMVGWNISRRRDKNQLSEKN